MPTQNPIREGLTYAVLDMIEDRLDIAGQKAEYTNIVRVSIRRGVTDHVNTLRVRISRDSYDAQSWAKVEAWRAHGWTTVHSIVGTAPELIDLPSSAAAKHDMMGAHEQFADASHPLLLIAMRVVA